MTDDGVRPANPFPDERAFEDSLQMNFHPVSGHQGRFVASHAMTCIGVVIDYQVQRRKRIWAPGVSSPGRPNDYVNLFLEETKAWLRHQMTLDNVQAEELARRDTFYTKLKNDDYYWCFPRESEQKSIHRVIDFVHERVRNALEIMRREEQNKSLQGFFKELNDHTTNVFEFGKFFLAYVLYPMRKIEGNLLHNRVFNGKTFQTGKLHRMLEKATGLVFETYSDDMQMTYDRIHDTNGSAKAGIGNGRQQEFAQQLQLQYQQQQQQQQQQLALSDYAWDGSRGAIQQQQTGATCVTYDNSGGEAGEAINSRVNLNADYLVEINDYIGANFAAAVYLVELADAQGYRWIVRKKYSDFEALHQIIGSDISDANQAEVQLPPKPSGVIISTRKKNEQLTLMCARIQAYFTNVLAVLANCKKPTQDELCKFMELKQLIVSQHGRILRRAEAVPNYFVALKKQFEELLVSKDPKYSSRSDTPGGGVGGGSGGYNDDTAALSRGKLPATASPAGARKRSSSTGQMGSSDTGGTMRGIAERLRLPSLSLFSSAGGKTPPLKGMNRNAGRDSNRDPMTDGDDDDDDDDDDAAGDDDGGDDNGEGEGAARSDTVGGEDMAKALIKMRAVWGIDMVTKIFEAYALLQRLATVLGWTLEINHFFISMFGNTLAFSKLPLRDIIFTLKDIMTNFLLVCTDLFGFACKLHADSKYKWHKNLQMAENELKRVKYHVDKGVALISLIDSEHLDYEMQVRRLRDVHARFQPLMHRIDGNLLSIQSELNLPLRGAERSAAVAGVDTATGNAAISASLTEIMGGGGSRGLRSKNFNGKGMGLLLEQGTSTHASEKGAFQSSLPFPQSKHVEQLDGGEGVCDHKSHDSRTRAHDAENIKHGVASSASSRHDKDGFHGNGKESQSQHACAHSGGGGAAAVDGISGVDDVDHTTMNPIGGSMRTGGSNPSYGLSDNSTVDAVIASGNAAALAQRRDHSNSAACVIC